MRKPNPARPEPAPCARTLDSTVPNLASVQRSGWSSVIPIVHVRSTCVLHETLSFNSYEQVSSYNMHVRFCAIQEPLIFPRRRSVVPEQSRGVHVRPRHCVISRFSHLDWDLS